MQLQGELLGECVEGTDALLPPQPVARLEWVSGSGAGGVGESAPNLMPGRLAMQRRQKGAQARVTGTFAYDWPLLKRRRIDGTRNSPSATLPRSWGP